MLDDIRRTKRAVMYLRVASPHQCDAAAISRQREAGHQIAAKHGLTIVREYVDLGRPARLGQQVELQQLLHDLAEKRDAEYVVVWDYARLARDIAQLDNAISQLRVRGAEVVTMTCVEAAGRFPRHQMAMPVAHRRQLDQPEAGWTYD